MKKYIIKITIIISSLVVTACATHGRSFDINAIDSLVPGETTVQEVIAKLGKPINTGKLPNGETILGWNYIVTSPVGTKSKFAQIQFHPNGTVKQVLSRLEQEN